MSVPPMSLTESDDLLEAVEPSGDLVVPSSFATQPRWSVRTRHPLWVEWLGHLMIAVAFGALAGLVWHCVVELPVYVVQSDGGATTTERGITSIFAIDAWYCLIGGVVAVALGMLTWRRFRRVGWPVAFLALQQSLVAALVAWWCGVLLGPVDFEERLYRATAGQRVPVDFALGTWVSVLVWLFFGIAPVLFGSSLGRELAADDLDQRPIDA